MPRYEFSQGTSNKFWEVSREGTSVTVTYGKIGTEGTSKTKEHPDEAAAEKDMAKQAASKVKKGYVLVEPGGAAPSGKQPLVGLEKEIGFDDHPKRFVFRTIVDYKPGKPGLSQAAKGVAYRIHFDFDDGGAQEMVERIAELGRDPNASKLQALVIGSWGEDCCTGEGGPEVAAAVAELAKACPAIEAIFLGDIVQEEAEVSWVEHGEWGQILSAYPKLEHFRVRGQSSAQPFTCPTLRSLVVQSMTSRDVCQAIGEADLPELEHLELWLGTDDYGGDSTVEDLAPILSGKLFPKLRYLGLRNAEHVNEICARLASAPILERIKVLDLSNGVLSDVGGNALLASPAVAKLERLDLHYNWLSADVAKKLRALGPEVDTSRGDADEEEDEEDRFVAVGE